MKHFKIKDSKNEYCIRALNYKDAIVKYKSLKKDSNIYTYEFPELTDEDNNKALKYNLKIIKKTSDSTFIRGSLQDLKRFAKLYLGYELVPSYLTKDALKKTI